MRKMKIISLISVFVLLASCQKSTTVEKVDVPKSNDKSTAATTNENVSKTQGNTKTGIKSPNNEPTKPVDDKTSVTNPDEIPQAIVEPMKDSQLMTAMKLIPKEAFDVTNTEGVAALCYGNQRLCFARMKYDFKKNIDEIAKQSPLFFYDIIKSPKNEFENPKNWLWSVIDLTLNTSWMAGDFNLNMNLTPILKKEKYKQYPLEYQYSYYLAPEDIPNPRYGKFVVPLADSLIMLGNTDLASLARKTATNIAEKDTGMLANTDYLKLLSHLGEPESASLVRIEKSLDVAKILADPNASKMPQDFRKILELLQSTKRPQTLKYIGLGFYPEQDYNLRFVLFYENGQDPATDMFQIKKNWSNPLFVKGEGWRKFTNLTSVRFSVKDNMGFIECKINKNMSSIDVVTSISVLLMTNSLYSLAK